MLKKNLFITVILAGLLFSAMLLSAAFAATTTTTFGRTVTTFGPLITTTTIKPLITTTTTTTTSPTTTTTLFTPGPFQIEFPSGDGKRMPYATGSFGGAIIIPPSSPGLTDIKGQPVIGMSSGGDVTGYWGAGYVLWEVGEEEWQPPVYAATYELADTGWIRQTNIVKNGNDLSITWDYDPNLGPTPARVYRSGGSEIEYDEGGAWAPVGPIQVAGDKEFSDVGVGSDDLNYYYRVVPVPLLPNTIIFSESNNSITVGKVNVNLPADLYVFAGLPFMEDNISLAGLLGDQLANGDEFLWWNGTAYEGATYSGVWTGTDRDLRVGEGFILRCKGSDRKVALLGRFGRFTEPCIIGLTANQYALIDYPYPTAKNLQASGLNPGSADDLLRWVVYVDPLNKQYYEGATWDGTAWVGPAGIDNLELARPRFYRPKNSLDWEINFP